MIERGDIYWVDLGEPVGHEPAKRRPVAVISSDSFNRSLLGTVVVAAVTSNLKSAAKPGSVFLPAHESGLTRDSVLNTSHIVTLNKFELLERAGNLPFHRIQELDAALRQSLGL